MYKPMIPGGIFGQKKGGVTWREGLKKPKSGEWRGVPMFFRVLIDRLKGAITPEKTAAVKRTYTEGILGLYKEAMGFARGREPKAAITAKAMALLPKLLSFQAAEAKVAVTLQQGQYTELKLIKAENQKQTIILNAQVEALRKIVVRGTGIDTTASSGNTKITGANPGIVPVTVGAF